MKKASCRRSEEEKRLHDRAVSLRKMTDAQLVAAVRDNAADKSRIAALEQEKQELIRRAENAEKGEAANARLTVQALHDLDEKKAELAKAEAKVEDLKERLAEACKALDESEEKAEKTTMVSSVPPEPQVDIRGGIRRWLIAYSEDAKGVGKAIQSNLLAVLDGTPDKYLEKVFEMEDANENM